MLDLDTRDGVNPRQGNRKIFKQENRTSTGHVGR